MLIVNCLTEYVKDGQTKTKWTPIGTAWENKDGSITARLEALPLSGKIHIGQPREKEPSR